MSGQIPLSFPIEDSYRSEDLMPTACNAEALAWIDRFPDWPYPVVVLYGEKGCGKTHLLSLWQDKKGSNDEVIDDVDGFFGNREAENKLFHKINMAKENGSFLLLSMEKPVGQQNITLPDLASRLRAAPQIEIQAPDEDALRMVFVKLFHDRQLKVEPGVIAYILPRMERSFLAVQSLVDQIDRNSMAEKRSVTVPLVRSILEAVG
jgi:chromosomal replication initiation ATPase DnaA